MMTLTYIVAAAVLLGLCIFVHELGHLMGGKMVGIKARVFSIGYGKGFFKKKFGDTTYQITLIPFGGYCQFYGENTNEERSGEGYEFLSAHPLRRIVTVAMGPLFNLFFGILIFFLMNLIGYTKETSRVYIPEHLKSGKYVSAAYQAGIRNGDRIIQINSEDIRDFADVQSSVIFSDGKELDVKVKRNGDVHDFKVTPNFYGDDGRYTLGVAPYGKRILIAGLLEGDVAEKAGLRKLDEIKLIDGKKIRTPGAFTDYIKQRAGREIVLTVVRSGEEIEIKITPRVNEIVTIKKSGKNAKKDDAMAVFDARTFNDFIKNSEVRINSESVVSFNDLVNMTNRYSGKPVTVELGDKKAVVRSSIEKRGFIGVYPAIAPEMINVSYGPGGAFIQSFVEPYEFIVLNIKGIGMLFSGRMNVRENLSGPIRIAKFAGDVAYYKGLSAFVLLMAKISIILMVMNLLPIPVVDGGHLVFFLVELVRGKPLSDRVMERIQTVGVVILITLGVFIIINDISMLPVIQKFFN